MSGFLSPLRVEALEGRRWRILEPVVYHVGSPRSPWVIRVPAGFETDFASVPRILWPIFPPSGRYSRAAVVHDWLCTQTDVSRVVGDAVFADAMLVLKVAAWRRWLMFAAVRLYGIVSGQG
jgi:hypothetical protein